MLYEVNVTQGVIAGVLTTAYDGTKYYSFEGIPYAQPPVGELRFRNPVPPENWTGVRNCTKPGNKCAQLNPFSSRGFEGSEDCLYLNVYTPCLPAEKLEKLPVLFFIHGGRLLLGYGDYYRPDFFMRHDVILVTINYRLNVLGFLSLDIPEAPGNIGMKDCVMALRWVHDNIRNFNGDSSNVTVFGESAGAAIAAAFLTSKMAVGLFHKLIAQSGNHIADIFFHIQDHTGIAAQVASLHGKEIKETKDLYEFYKSLPVNELVELHMMGEMGKSPYVLTPLFSPIIEKQFDGVECFWPEHPQDVMNRNNFIKVPTIAGSCMWEGAVFVRRDENGDIFYERDMKYFVPVCLYLKETDQKAKSIAKTIKDYYFKEKEINNGTLLEYVKLVSEGFFQRDITLFGEILAKYNDNFYAYCFNYEGGMNLRTMKELGLKGTTHGDSLMYQFYRKNKADKYSKRDMNIADFLSQCWCNFARNGKPTWTNQSIEWKPYTPHEKLTLIIDDEKELKKNEHWDSYTFWRGIICDEKSKL